MPLEAGKVRGGESEALTTFAEEYEGVNYASAQGKGDESRRKGRLGIERPEI